MSAWRGGGGGGGGGNGYGRGGGGGRGTGNGRGRGSYSGQARRDGGDGGNPFPPLGNVANALPQVQAAGAGGSFWANGALVGGAGNGNNGNVADGRNGQGAAGRVGARRGEKLDRNLKFDRVDTRPERLKDSKEGTSGSKLQLFSNYFAVKTKPDWAIYNHRVDIAPDDDLLTSQKKRLLRNLRDNLTELGTFIFDGTNLYSVSRFIGPQEQVKVLYSTLPNSDVNYQITMKLVAQVQPGDVVCIQFYNIIMRSCLQLLEGFEELGRHFFDARAEINMAGIGLDLWPGFITTLRQHENSLLLCVEVTHKVLRRDSCLAVIRGNNNRENVRNELVGSVVMTRYNNKTYRVDDIHWDQTPSLRFQKRDGSFITLHQYFREKYPQLFTGQAPALDMNQPLLVSMPSKKDCHRGERPQHVLLIPQFCNMTGLSDAMRANFNAMREVSAHLQLPPTERVGRIHKLMERLRSSPPVQRELEGWRLNFDSALVPLNGRVQTGEEIRMRLGNRETKLPTQVNRADWTIHLRDKQMFSSARLVDWVIIVPQRDFRNVELLVRKLQEVGASRKLDFEVQPPMRTYQITDSRNLSYTKAIQEAVAEFRDRLTMVFAIVPNQAADLYSAIKRTCILEYGIASQCFQGKHLAGQENRLLSVMTKVVVQINAKLGGEPWAVDNPMKSMNAMVVGFDVHHSGRGRMKKSVGAMVATTNPDMTRYYSTVFSHQPVDDEKSLPSPQELSNKMTTNMIKCLDGYFARNQKFPSRIMFYRDGVGEGYLHYVKNTELDQLKTGIAAHYEARGLTPPRLTFIVVTKKGNTRIFTKGQGNGYGNPPPGTVVDTTITLPERYDFYLVAQESRLGTVSPTAFNVIYDEGEGRVLSPDMMQRFTFKLCHLYYNWSGTVAVPAVCQYAHKLAFLTGVALNNTPASENLAHLLYFL